MLTKKCPFEEISFLKKCPFRRNVGTSENMPNQENGTLTNRLFKQLTFRRIDEIQKIGFVGLFVLQCFNQANI